ncbi:MAG: site-specific DNA-methyltransferase [Ignavibacteria bacterium]|jgi:site-specific DNA-methyltransferase (adenine-specific)
MLNFSLPRLDKDKKLKKLLLKYCRLSSGEIWVDPENKHVVGCLDAADEKDINKIFGRKKAQLAIQDPPYNFVAFNKTAVDKFIEWSKIWINLTDKILSKDSSLYVWLGADNKNNFEPFAEFIIMMRDSGFDSKNFITMRNQRGFGTQVNWMAIRQELLFYTKGQPVFNTEAVYTDIPKILKGYYKEVNGAVTENIERSKSAFIRAGNVWVDIQQVFHLMEENVNGCYAQKPLKAIERIVGTSSRRNGRVVDLFSHSGTTLIACEKLKRKCITVDIDPIYCEITIRRLENFRNNGKTGWQNSNPFEKEILTDKKIKSYLKRNYNIIYKENK